MEHDITASTRPAGDLPKVIDAFTHALADGFSAGDHVIPHVVGASHDLGSSERSRRALENIQRAFLDATTVHLHQVRRSDPTTALVIALRTIIAACIHRTITGRAVPDGISWDRCSEEVADMATLHLTTPDPADRPE